MSLDVQFPALSWVNLHSSIWMCLYRQSSNSTVTQVVWYSYSEHVSYILNIWKKSQIATFSLLHISYHTSPLYVPLCLQTVLSCFSVMWISPGPALTLLILGFYLSFNACRNRGFICLFVCYLAPIISYIWWAPSKSLLLIWTQLYSCDNQHGLFILSDLFAFWLCLTYSKVVHLKCRYKCFLQSMLVMDQRRI